MDLRPDILMSAAGGYGVAAVLSRYVFTKALKDLEKVAERVAKIDIHLARISVRLEKLLEHDHSIKELQKRVAK